MNSTERAFCRRRMAEGSLRTRSQPDAPIHAGSKPDSIGMSESFVKTFKRDYVRCNPRPDAQTVLAQLESWFEGYNDVYPQPRPEDSRTARVHSG